LTIREKAINTACKIVENHCAYIWGAQGMKIKGLDPKVIDRMETSPANAEKVKQFIAMLDAHGWLTSKSKAFDCSGLICYILTKLGVENPGFDMKADMLAGRYPRRAVIRPGVLLHRPEHIAIYIGNNYLVEAKGRVWGVCVSPYVAKEWESTFPDPFKE